MTAMTTCIVAEVPYMTAVATYIVAKPAYSKAKVTNITIKNTYFPFRQVINERGGGVKTNFQPLLMFFQQQTDEANEDEKGITETKICLRDCKS